MRENKKISDVIEILNQKNTPEDTDYSKEIFMLEEGNEDLELKKIKKKMKNQKIGEIGLFFLRYTTMAYVHKNFIY